MNSNKITKSQRKKDETEQPVGQQKRIKMNQGFTNVLWSINFDLT